MNKDEVINRAQELLGVPEHVSMPPKKDVIFSFRQDPVYMALKMVAEYDRENEKYKQAEPRITLSVNGTYHWVPLSADFFKEWGQFLTDLGEIVGEIEVSEKECDVEKAKAMIQALMGRTEGDDEG